MFDSQYEIIATLQYRNKSLHAQLEAFKSGEKYKQIGNAVPVLFAEALAKSIKKNLDDLKI